MIKLQAPFLSLSENNPMISSTLLKLGFHDLHYILHFEYNISNSFSNLKISPSARNFLEIQAFTSTIHPNPTKKKLFQFQYFKLGFVDNRHKLEYLV